MKNFNEVINDENLNESGLYGKWINNQPKWSMGEDRSFVNSEIIGRMLIDIMKKLDDIERMAIDKDR